LFTNSSHAASAITSKIGFVSQWTVP